MVDGMNPSLMLGGAIYGGGGATAELSKYLRKKIQDYDNNTSSSQTDKTFVEDLKKYRNTDSLKGISEDINEFLKDFDAAELKSPGNPKLPSPKDTSPLPRGREGTSNPFFNQNPMATFFSTFMNVIKLMGQISQLQSESALVNMQLTLATAKDQANATLQEGIMKSKAQEKQASLEFGMSAVSFVSAAGTVAGGIHAAGKSARELKPVNKAAEKLEKQLDNVTKIVKNTKDADIAQKEFDQAAKQLTTLEKKMGAKKPEKGALEVEEVAVDEGAVVKKAGKKGDIAKKEALEDEAIQVQEDVAAEADKAFATVKKKTADKAKVDKEFEEMTQVRNKDDLEKSIQKNKDDILNAEKEVKDLSDKEKQLTKDIKKQEDALNKSELAQDKDPTKVAEDLKKKKPEDLKSEEKQFLEKFENMEKSVEERSQVIIKKEIAEVKGKMLQTNQKTDELELNKINGTPPKSFDEPEKLTTEHADNIDKLNAIQKSDVFQKLSPEAQIDFKKDILNMEGDILKNNHNAAKLRVNDKSKLEALESNTKALQNNAKEKKELLSQDSKMHEEKLEKYLNEDHGLESDHLHLSKQSELFKNNDMEGLKKEMKDNLRDIGKTQRDLTGETFNTMSSWKYQSWQAFSQGVNSLLGGLKTLTEADATLKSAQWEYIKTLDQAQQQILSQAMQSMLESSKQSLDQGASFSQALMGFSDKGSGIVHWAA